jgi:hypothetical protein
MNKMVDATQCALEVNSACVALMKESRMRRAGNKRSAAVCAVCSVRSRAEQSKEQSSCSGGGKLASWHEEIDCLVPERQRATGEKWRSVCCSDDGSGAVGDEWVVWVRAWV